MRMVALIPARGGSTRIERKNVKLLGGRPLIAWTIAAAKASRVFGRVVVSTEDDEIGNIALQAGADFGIHRPSEMADPHSSDIEWVTHALETQISANWVAPNGDILYLHDRLARFYDAFAILRPTSPFRTADTIRRAHEQFVQNGPNIDSLRAVERVSQHPGKMWTYDPTQLLIEPYARFGLRNPPAHSRATQSLPPIYVQNASLEMAWTKTVAEQQSISGERVMPFFTEGWEGFDINHPVDWIMAESLIRDGLVKLGDAAPAFSWSGGYVD